MSSIIIKSFIIFLFVFFPFTANSKKCYKEDFINFVSDHVGCIAINIHEDENFDIAKSNKNKLIIFIHGDSINSKITYFDNFALNFIDPRVLLISIVRPGWKNFKNNKSDGKINISKGDNYIPKNDIDPIYRTIKKLKKHYKINETIVIGHSGGAAITGILYGRFPKLINEAILISCPCIVPLWRRDHFKKLADKNNTTFCFPKFKSHSPHDYINKINPNLKIYIFVGKDDENTIPYYSEKYHELLVHNNKNSELYLLKGGHESLLKNNKLVESIKRIILG